MAGAAVRFGIVFLPETLTGWGELCREAEDTGFEWLGVAESQSVFRELYVALTLAAPHPRGVRLGPLVTNPPPGHLVVPASAIGSVDELSGGRAVLGLASGDSAIYPIGAPPAPPAGLEDSIVTLGRLTAGETVERAGRPWRVHRSARRVPIYLAAEGPRTLELAGRVADGVIVGLGLTPEVVRLSLAAIERGARPAGRTLDDVDVWWFAKTSLADRREQAIAPIKMALAASANHAFRFTLEGKGVPPGAGPGDSPAGDGGRQARQDHRRARALRGTRGDGPDEPAREPAQPPPAAAHGHPAGAARRDGRAGHRRRGPQHQSLLVQGGPGRRHPDLRAPEREARPGLRGQPGSLRGLRHRGAPASRPRRGPARGGREEVQPARGRHRGQRQRRGGLRSQVPPVL